MDAQLLQEYYECIHIATANCPSETVVTRSKATEGVDKTNEKQDRKPMCSLREIKNDERMGSERMIKPES